MSSSPTAERELDLGLLSVIAEDGRVDPALDPRLPSETVLSMYRHMRRVRLMAQEATPVRVEMRSDGLELIAITQDVGEAHEQLDAEYDGQELTVAFNPQYLLDGVEVCGGEKITLETVDALKPAVLRSSGDDEFLYLLMPVRVS